MADEDLPPKNTRSAEKTVSIDTNSSIEEPMEQGSEAEDEKAVDICIVDPDTKELEMNHQRIAKLENLEPLTQVECLYMRWNTIKRIENLDSLVTLRELELYDNQITTLENLSCLVNLEVLDVSFNRLRKIEGLENLRNLQKLFLCSNRITRMENLGHLGNLVLLELGDNKLRVIENLEGLDNLKSLFLGKNKIVKIENLDSLTNLEVLSIQRVCCAEKGWEPLSKGNRITKIENLGSLVKLDQLYLSENGIQEMEGLDNNPDVTTLDLAKNKIHTLQNIEHMAKLEELWLNNNLMDDWSCMEKLSSNRKLATIYLDRNPVAADANYRRKLKLTLPWITQIDATLCR